VAHSVCKCREQELIDAEICSRETDEPDRLNSNRDLAIEKAQENKMKSTEPIGSDSRLTFNTAESQNNVLDFSTTLRELRNVVDPTLIRQRAGQRDRDGNVRMVEYIEWHTVADILDEHAPNWSLFVKDIRSIGDIVTVTVALTINGVTREGVGTGRMLTETAVKTAEHDALKRAAVKFGIARELYKQEFNGIALNESGRPIGNDDPVARNLGEMVTAKQLGMIKGLARDAETDAELECKQLLQCGVEELSRRAASDFIDHLQDLQRSRKVRVRRAG
jgi:Rad52/22 family double-strand break repair protein